MSVLQFPHISPWWHLLAAECHCYLHLYRCHAVDNLIASNLFHLLCTWVLVCSTELSCICQDCPMHILNLQLLSQLNKGRTLNLAKYIVQLIHLNFLVSKVFKAASILISYNLLVPAASFSIDSASMGLDISNTFAIVTLTWSESECCSHWVKQWMEHVLKILLG